VDISNTVLPLADDFGASVHTIALKLSFVFCVSLLY